MRIEDLVGLAYIRIQRADLAEAVTIRGRIDNIQIRQVGQYAVYLSFQVEDVLPSQLQSSSEHWNCEYCKTENILGPTCPGCGVAQPAQDTVGNLYGFYGGVSLNPRVWGGR